jgi:dihydroorotate dehydrogenase electron transfer subunit
MTNYQGSREKNPDRKQLVTVISNEQISNDYYLLQVLQTENMEKPQPGQFYHLKITSNRIAYDPLLRRPLSLHNLNEEKGIVGFLYRVIGRGTQSLTEFKSGDKLDLLGPLGRGFKIDFMDKKLLVVGGGMGVAPLYYLSKKLKENNQLTILLGFNSDGETTYFRNIFKRITPEPRFSTLDGSSGYQGTVVDLLKETIKGSAVEYDYLFACGPRPMLNSVKVLAQKQNLPGQVSLEERMGCGTGVCLSCVCKSVAGNRRVCTDGPVFEFREVILDEGDDHNV